ncbi:hypothetical protein AA0312_1592 [Acetobacter tropicalis NRIC 0312]|nr:hypothetical protein ATR1_069d0102 [Acetobacter tropicalis]GBR69883.1 hypothetical protein AA0312_1592 [Acetobacter tropicalis NRIC 0312]
MPTPPFQPSVPGGDNTGTLEKIFYRKRTSQYIWHTSTLDIQYLRPLPSLRERPAALRLSGLNGDAIQPEFRLIWHSLTFKFQKAISVKKTP